MFNDETMSNFDQSGFGRRAEFTECAVWPQDYHKIHKVRMLYMVSKDSDEGRLIGLQIQDKQGTTLMETLCFDAYVNHHFCKVNEVILQGNERLLGVTSATHPDPNLRAKGNHIDLQFVIGGFL